MSKVKGISAVLANLANYKKTIPQAAITALVQGAQRIQKSARDFAPLDEGPLENSIKVREEITSARASVAIYVDESMPTSTPGKTVGRYAMKMHEGIYSLGALSRAKQARLGVKVGRKYLERALKKHRPAIVQALRDSVSRVIK